MDPVGLHRSRRSLVLEVARVREVLRAKSSIDLYWLPLGAGDNTHCVRTNGRLYERWCALRERRPAADLFHAALVVHLDGVRFTVEMAPVWSGGHADHGAVCEGPVRDRWLGRSRWFRYEVRSWRDGLIPDLDEAVDSPVRISDDRRMVTRVLELLPQFPTATWGRDELGTGDMWNSNSLVAWALARAGAEVSTLRPPTRGRAPGWSAGLVVADRDQRLVTT
jgi:hypothetical protein